MIRDQAIYLYESEQLKKLTNALRPVKIVATNLKLKYVSVFQAKQKYFEILDRVWLYTHSVRLQAV